MSIFMVHSRVSNQTQNRRRMLFPHVWRHVMQDICKILLHLQKSRLKIETIGWLLCGIFMDGQSRIWVGRLFSDFQDLLPAGWLKSSHAPQAPSVSQVPDFHLVIKDGVSRPGESFIQGANAAGA
ncbi:MAG: hypothetical protein V4573_02000 [Pseudomonadota bacterium]